VGSERFGSVEQVIVAGVALRCDGGRWFCSDRYQAEIDDLGSPARRRLTTSPRPRAA
jgi:hypothetical protein